MRTIIPTGQPRVLRNAAPEPGILSIIFAILVMLACYVGALAVFVSMRDRVPLAERVATGGATAQNARAF
jgi:hypothetical protein